MVETENATEQKVNFLAKGIAWLLVYIVRSPPILGLFAGIIGISIGGGAFTSLTNMTHGQHASAKMDSVLQILTPMAQAAQLDHLEIHTQGKEIRKLRGSFLELKGARQASARYEERDRAYQRERVEHGDTTSREASPDSVEKFVVNRSRRSLP